MSIPKELGSLLPKLQKLKQDHDEISQHIQIKKDELLQRLMGQGITQIKINNDSKNDVISTMTIKTRTRNKNGVIVLADEVTEQSQ